MKHEQNKEKTDYRSLAPEHDGITLTESQENLLGYFMYRYIGYSEQRANNDEWFFISYRDFVDHLGGSYSTLRVNIHQLFKYGFIERAQTKKRQANLYRITEPYRTHFYDIPVIEGVADGVAVQQPMIEGVKASVADGVAVSVADATSVADGVAVQTTKNENVKAGVAEKCSRRCSTDTETEKETDLEIEKGKEKEIEKLRKENTKMKEEIVELSKRVETLTATVESLKGIFEKLNATLGNMGGFAPVSALPTSTSTIENNFEGGVAPVTVQGYEKDSKRALWDDWNGFADRIKCTGFEDGDSEKYQLFARRIAALYNDDTAERSKRLHSIQSQWRKLRADAECGLIETHTTATAPITPQQTPDEKAIEAIADLRRRWNDYKTRYPQMNDADRRSQYYTMRGQIEALPCHPSLKPDFTATLDAEYQELLKGNYTADPTPSNIPPTGTDSDDLPF